jgi:hypothetical protein
MIDKVFLFAGALIVAFWGVAHLLPTKSVVKGFGDISPDNKRIITMEWVIEGFALIFIGFLVIAVTLVDPDSVVSRYVYFISFTGLLILSVISLFTGFRINFLPFRLCPFIFSASAILIFIGAMI